MIRSSRESNAESADDRGDRSQTVIEILSNLSLTLDRLAGFFLVLSAVTLTVAALPALMGYWPVLLIAVIHLVIVGWCFRLAWRGNWVRQEIRIDADRVSIRLRTVDQASSVNWPTGWVRLEQRRDHGEPQVFLVNSDQKFEIGHFVPASERIEAAQLIVEALQPYSAWSDNEFNEIVSSG
ncbi:MAG: DUF2244 domain-containing protein [Wenzhouxiangellaceae bacterium]|nr:DUF2244 domain-containing protein [Wenzhouxiangellaceae bacterium]